ncbi:MAG: MBOAT family protein [Lachnospiraceae bacterium]|nr:MBOAT family protein [Lachnospiraceae bacterium]
MFQTYSFLFLFLPVLLAGWYLLLHRGMHRAALSFLCAMSLMFYASFGVRALLLLAGSVLLTVLISRLMTLPGVRARGALVKGLAAAGIVSQLFLLLLYKIPPSMRLLLPVGLGFYTLRHIAYLADVANEGERDDLYSVLAFLLFFPTLTQGPITLREDMIGQFTTATERPFRAEFLARGLSLFTLGLAKKLLVADTLGHFVDLSYEYLPRTETLSAAVAVFLFVPQLYFDFSGYCDMAEGISGMLGLRLPLNFDSPLQAASAKELWRRWHITLSRFFLRYVYQPLGGSRRGKGRAVLLTLMVFLISGFWHGSTLGYLIWGFLAGLPVALRALGKDSSLFRTLDRLPLVLRRLVTFVWVSLAFVFFRAPDVETALTMLRHLLLPVPISRAFIRVLPTLVVTPESWLVKNLFAYANPALEELGAWLFAALFLCLVIVLLCAKNARRRVSEWTEAQFCSLPRALLLSLLLAWSVLSFSGVGSFLYFQY